MSSGQVEPAARGEAIARTRGHGVVGTEHLLLALTRADEGSFARHLLDELGITQELRERVESAIGPDP